jgi:hypothetical protein
MERNFGSGSESIGRDIASNNGVFQQINHRSEVQFFHNIFPVQEYGMSADEQEI